MQPRRDAARIKVLIVDDDEEIRNLLAMLLESLGDTHHASDGRQALEMLEGLDFDVVFLDLQMPRMGGIEFLKEKMRLGLNAVVIVLTGLACFEDSVAAMRLGAFDFLTKPIDTELLHIVMARAAEHARLLRHDQVLQRLVAEWEITFDSCPDLMAVLDSNCTILRCNRAFEQSLHQSRDRIVGRSLHEFLDLGKESPLLASCIETFRSGETRICEINESNLGGDFQITTARLLEPGGPSLGVILIAKDIVDRKLAEAERGRSLALEQAALVAANASQKKFALLAGVSSLLTYSLDYRPGLAKVARLVVPMLADVCAIHLLDKDGTIHRLAPLHPHTLQLAWSGQALAALQAPGETPHPIASVLSSGQARILHSVSEAYLLGPVGNARLVDSTSLSRTANCMILPLQARGRVLGAISFIVAASRRCYESAEITLGQDLAMRIAVAVDTAQLLQETRMHEQQLRSLASELSTAEDKERRRLALSIHDSIGQTLSVVKLNLESLQRAGTDKTTVAVRVGDILRMMDQLIEQTRSMTFDLYPAMLDDLGLTPTLLWYRDQFQSQTGLDLQVSEFGRSQVLSPAVANYLFRTIKELLNNVAKHARAREVVLAIHWQEERVRVVLTDDGCGFKMNIDADSPPRRGLGLLGIRERMASLGGLFILESWPGQGANVILEVPTLARLRTISSDTSNDAQGWA